MHAIHAFNTRLGCPFTSLLSLYRLGIAITLISVQLLGSSPVRADLASEALETAKRATQFLTQEVATQGGYLWRYSADLRLREGEGVVNTQTIWVQPPGTPAIGSAWVNLYRATRDIQFLHAARQVAAALRSGQMRSGGWQAHIEFQPELRKKWAYRVDKPSPRAKDQSSLDDDKTQSALRFLIQLDAVTQFQDAEVHEMALYGLAGLLKHGQLPGGSFPQVWTDKPHRAATELAAISEATFPESWSRIYEGHQEYWLRPTLNDNSAPDVLDTLILAYKTYGDSLYLESAKQLGDFLIAAQLPEPQPAWAQQYNFQLQPMWARKFEPPAITGGESQGVIESLMLLYRLTHERRYLEPIPPALEYLRRSLLADGQLARFYELQTNRPLYFTREYELTYSDTDLPTHYGFKVASRLEKLQRQYQQLAAQPVEQVTLPPEAGLRFDSQKRTSQTAVRHMIDQLDERGAWLSTEAMRYHKAPGPTIDMRQVVSNLNALAAFLGDNSQ